MMLPDEVHSDQEDDGWRGIEYSTIEVETLESCERLLDRVLGEGLQIVRDILERADSGVGPTVPEIYRIRTLFESV